MSNKLPKVLWRTKLTDLETTDVEGLGVVRTDEDGNKYKWVKNAGATAVGRAGPCLAVLNTSVAASNFAGTRITPQDTSSTYTAVIQFPAGQPMTAIQESGSSTGDHGWVQCKGWREDAQITITSVGGSPGALLMATRSLAATPSWAYMATTTIFGNFGAVACGIATIASTTPATAAYARTGQKIFINCLV
jgi:hypothetical protein